VNSENGGITFLPDVGSSVDTTQNRRKLKFLSVFLREPQHPQRNAVSAFRSLADLSKELTYLQECFPSLSQLNFSAFDLPS